MLANHLSLLGLERPTKWTEGVTLGVDCDRYLR